MDQIQTANPQNNPGDYDGALLTEYESGQEAVSSHIQAYWTLTGIFIAVSTALLAGLIFGLLANESLLDDFLQTTSLNATPQVWLIRILVLTLGTAMLVIFYALWRWYRRTQYLCDVIYTRMREIEQITPMQRSSLFTDLDNWEQLTEQRRIQLKVYQGLRVGKGYEPPSRRFFGPAVIWTLVVLWVLAIFGTFFVARLIG